MIHLLAASIAFVLGIAYSSFFEWVLHRHLMHSKRFLKYPHRAHQLEHHGIFKADATYFLSRELHPPDARRHLTFAWWNAPLLLGLHAPIYGAAYFLAGPWALAGAVLAMLAYYGLYEYLHFCMHVPKGRWLETTRFFKFVQAHHRLHHVYYYKNLNVVFPLADVVLGTRVSGDPQLFERLEEVRRQRIARQRETALRA